MLFNSALAKGVFASLLVGLGGWTAHTLVEARSNSQMLSAHTQQLDRLEAGQTKQEDTLKGLGVAVAQINGKLDVVNQKIDDDRRAVHRRDDVQ